MKYGVSLLVALVALSGTAGASDTPYRGFQDRPIKALSQQQADDLRAGRGMGFALAAELNDYPGPRHVLDLSDRLGLSPDQRDGISKLFDEMAARAQALGARILDAETRLDRLFASGNAAEAEVRASTSRIANLTGELRYVHLRYHLLVRDLLSENQIAQYRQLRGYGADSGEERPGHRHHGAGHQGHR